MTPIAFTLTEADMLAASRLGMVSTLRANIGRLVLTLIGVSGFIAALISLFDWDGWVGLAKLFGILLAIYVAILIIALPLIWFFLVKWRVRKNMRQIAALSREQQLSWNTESFEVTSSQGNSRFPYAEIHQWAANDMSLIIYPADHIFFAFPMRMFGSEPQHSSFIEALNASTARRI